MLSSIFFTLIYEMLNGNKKSYNYILHIVCLYASVYAYMYGLYYIKLLLNFFAFSSSLYDKLGYILHYIKQQMLYTLMILL